MKKILFAIKYFSPLVYVLWVLFGSISAIRGNVAAGLSFLWLPLSFVFFAVLALSIIWIYGDIIKRRAPKSCENCVFWQQRKETGKCVGEQLGYTYGKPCRVYSRYSYNKPGTEMHKNSGIGYGEGSEPE